VKIAVILGTRPEVIKMSPVIRELEKNQADFFVLHTGQHYEVPISCTYHSKSSTINPVSHGFGVAFTVVKLRLKELR